MTNRILSWSTLSAEGNLWHLPPAYYIDGDYEKVAVRINAEQAPSVEEAEFNIYADRVSIFSDHSSITTRVAPTKGQAAVVDGVEDTSITLSVNDTSEVMAENFSDAPIESGSWVTCNCIKDGGGRNFSIHLELKSLFEDEEESE